MAFVTGSAVLGFMALGAGSVGLVAAAGQAAARTQSQGHQPGPSWGLGAGLWPGRGPGPGGSLAVSLPGESPVELPASMLALYERAAATCNGLPWTVVAGIGTVESANGTSLLPGVRSGANSAGAEGPMQMEPATFAAYALPVPPGGVSPPTPYDPADAVYAAVRDLCANGGAGGADIPGAIYAYNHSRAYVTRVLSYAGAYARVAPAASPDPAATEALGYALAQIGTPYRWGGETPGAGFDCSGLVQAAYASAGIALPRVAQAQFDAGPRVGEAQPLQPGDLVFFGAGPSAVEHVGIVVDPSGEMVDAPHAGARVRAEPFAATPGAAWGSERFIGATRPAAG